MRGGRRTGPEPGKRHPKAPSSRHRAAIERDGLPLAAGGARLKSTGYYYRHGSRKTLKINLIQESARSGARGGDSDIGITKDILEPSPRTL
jgi:hypothetical protein